MMKSRMRFGLAAGLGRTRFGSCMEPSRLAMRMPIGTGSENQYALRKEKMNTRVTKKYRSYHFRYQRQAQFPTLLTLWIW